MVSSSRRSSVSSTSSYPASSSSPSPAPDRELHSPDPHTPDDTDSPDGKMMRIEAVLNPPLTPVSPSSAAGPSSLPVHRRARLPDSPPPSAHPAAPLASAQSPAPLPRSAPQPSSSSRHTAHTTSRPLAVRKRTTKGEALYTLGAPRAKLQFPSFPIEDFRNLPPATRTELKQAFQTHYLFPPLEQIGSYPRSVPYQSRKKDFNDKTGKDTLEVFQYEFEMPKAAGGQSTAQEVGRRWIVVWDYELGLVKVTAFFKCLNYPKTQPAKVISMNPGLKDISHSVTGGDLIAQGYWLPYASARAICATFCWPIRHVLVPVFGASFLDDCVRDTDPAYKSFRIDPAIIKADADRLGALRLPAPSSSGLQPSPAAVAQLAHQARVALDLQDADSDDEAVSPKTIPVPRSAKEKGKGKRRAGSPEDSDSDRERHRADRYFMSPVGSPSTGWTAINSPGTTPRSAFAADFPDLVLRPLLPLPGSRGTIAAALASAKRAPGSFAAAERGKRQRVAVEDEEMPDADVESSVSSCTAPSTPGTVPSAPRAGVKAVDMSRDEVDAVAGLMLLSQQ